MQKQINILLNENDMLDRSIKDEKLKIKLEK